MPAEVLPTTARAISLLLASNPSIQDIHPGVLHQLLEFSHRYTYQVLSDALVYAEHGGRAGKVDLEDVMLAIQARVGWELGGRVPKEVDLSYCTLSYQLTLSQFILSLATQTNSTPLPAVPEVFGVRHPPAKDCLVSVDFNLVPNKPPPNIPQYEEEEYEETDEEGDEDEEDEDDEDEMEEMDVTGANGAADGDNDELDDAEGLFGDDDDDMAEDVSMHEPSAEPSSQTQGVKRTLVEDDDYD